MINFASRHFSSDDDLFQLHLENRRPPCRPQHAHGRMAKQSYSITVKVRAVASATARHGQYTSPCSLYIRFLFTPFFFTIRSGESGRLVGSVDGQMNRLTYKAEDPKDVRRR